MPLTILRSCCLWRPGPFISHEPWSHINSRSTVSLVGGDADTGRKAEFCKIATNRRWEPCTSTTLLTVFHSANRCYWPSSFGDPFRRISPGEAKIKRHSNDCCESVCRAVAAWDPWTLGSIKVDFELVWCNENKNVITQIDTGFIVVIITK